MDSWSNAAFSEEESMTLVRECLAAGHRVRYFHFRGVSMLPMLRQGIDSVELAPLPERLKKYDLPVYQYPSGKYVMHRILKVRKDDYVLCGDNRWMREFGVKDEWIIGILTAVIRDGKTIPVTDRRYQRYVHLRCDFYWIRAFILRARGVLRKFKRKK